MVELTERQNLRCPHCEEITLVYHQDWTTLACPECKKEVPKTEWKPVYFDSFGNPLVIGDQAALLIKLRRDVERTCLYHDLGEIHDKDLEFTLNNLATRFIREYQSIK